MSPGELKADLADEIIVITGGGGVLCSTIGKGLAENGATVALLDIDEDAAAEVADEIQQDGGTALPVACDVLDKDSLRAATETVESELGTPTTVINGAGGNKPEATTAPDMEFFDLPQEAVQWVFNLNFVGTLVTSQVFGRTLADEGRGQILNISSMNAFRPLTKIPAYSAAKAAVSNFTQWLAVHMSHNHSEDIRVNAIAPGFFLTQQNRFLLIDEDTGDLTDRGQTIIDHTPQDRFGRPEDLIGTTLWLLSSSSSFVHGTVIPVDGGFSAFSGV